MAEVKKCIMNSTVFAENICNIKEELENDDFEDNKVLAATTNVIDDAKCAVQDCISHDKIKEFEITALNNIKTNLSSSEVYYDNIKIEEGIHTDIKIECENEPLYCEDCAAYYQDYCTKCGMLVHILNRNTLNNTDNKTVEGIPNKILEIRDSFGQSGIFALKVIPEGVKFGPFIGLNRTECNWTIRGGRLIVNNNRSKQLNWMQYINPARSTSEQNMLVFQYADDLYYQSIREIHIGDELLVYFGKEYEDSLVKNIEMDFVPTIKHSVKDAFGCTFCCLGFSSISYLAIHKSLCLQNATAGFSIEELVQCPWCKIHLDEKEYFKHHMAYCCERNGRKYNPTTPDNLRLEENECKTPRFQVYKCKQCKYRTKYKAELINHTNQHSEVKAYKCRICNKRFKTNEIFSLHVENRHNQIGRKANLKHSSSDYTNAPIKSEQSLSEEELQQWKCLICEFQTKYKYCLNRHIKTKHIKECNYKSENLELNSDCYIKVKDVAVFEYKCELCKFNTNRKDHLKHHRKTKHFKVFDFKCGTCKFRTNRKDHLEYHVKTTHLKEFKYNCDTCAYKTNQKSNLKCHRRTKHLKEFNYKCDGCSYKTNQKSNLEYHVKTTHLKEFKYNCDKCPYKTNQRSNLESHRKTKHLKEFDYKCDMCHYKTNRKSDLGKHRQSKRH